MTKGFLKRKKRVRGKISGTMDRPRIVVFRSNKYVYVQAIDDEKGVTIFSAKGTKAEEVGVKIANFLIKKKINCAVFDKSGYIYHGKVKEVAQGARSAGLTI